MLVGYFQQRAPTIATTDHRRRLLFELIINQRSRSSVTSNNKHEHLLPRIIVVGYSSINSTFAIALVGYLAKIRAITTTLPTTDHRRRLLLLFRLIFKINYHRAASIIVTVSRFNRDNRYLTAVTRPPSFKRSVKF
jgi:hypothetical protein